MAVVLKSMILGLIPMQIVTSVLLFLGSLEQKIWALGISFWLLILVASYNTVLGVLGTFYFVRYGYYTVHFFLSVSFICMMLSLYVVLCHDILVVYTYKKLLQNPNIVPVSPRRLAALIIDTRDSPPDNNQPIKDKTNE